MTKFDAFRYDGKRVLVVGGASGMGAAAAEVVRDAGAEVVVMDFAEVTLTGVKSIHINLGDAASIDNAIEQAGGKFDALLSCAGVADGTPGLEKINFIGHKRMIDKLVATGMLGRGSSIGFISSAAGLGWEANLDILREYIAITDFDAASKWAIDNGKADYYWSKQTVCAYVATSAMSFQKQGIRINAICPGPTDTPLAQANKDMWLGFGADYREEVGIEAATPLEQAYPLVFLCSEAASAVNGIIMVTDSGYFSSGMTNTYPPAADITKFLLGRM
jgi:NAD(P)-dependent dehydrogenase (short-subunit alcohol dehydrogenase family)